MLRRARNRIVGQQGGWSLVEVLVAMTLTLGIVGTAMVQVTGAQHVQRRDEQFAYALQQARTGLADMVREIRQARSVLGVTPNSVDFVVTLAGVDQQVYYECDVPQSGTTYNECVRLQAAVGASLPALSTGRVSVPNLLNGTAGDPVFSWSPDQINPTFVQVQVKVPSGAGLPGSGPNQGLTHTIVLDDGAFMRNLAVG